MLLTPPPDSISACPTPLIVHVINPTQLDLVTVTAKLQNASLNETSNLLVQSLLLPAAYPDAALQGLLEQYLELSTDLYLSERLFDQPLLEDLYELCESVHFQLP